MLTWSYKAHLHFATRDSSRDLAIHFKTRRSQCMCFVVQASVGISGATSTDTCALDRPKANLALRTEWTSLQSRAHLVVVRPLQFCKYSSSTSFPRSRARLDRYACKLPRTNKRPSSLLRVLPKLTKAARTDNASVIIRLISAGRKLASQHLGVIGASLVLLAAPCVAADLPVVSAIAIQVNA